METTDTTVTATTIKQRMAERGIRVSDLAREAGLYSTNVSSYLSGSLRCGPRAQAHLVRGILRLGLHKETPQPKPEAEQVVIHLPPDGEQTDSEKAEAEG